MDERINQPGVTLAIDVSACKSVFSLSNHMAASFLSMNKRRPKKSRTTTAIPKINGARNPNLSYKAPPIGGATMNLFTRWFSTQAWFHKVRLTRLCDQSLPSLAVLKKNPNMSHIVVVYGVKATYVQPFPSVPYHTYNHGWCQIHYCTKERKRGEGSGCIRTTMLDQSPKQLMN